MEEAAKSSSLPRTAGEAHLGGIIGVLPAPYLLCLVGTGPDGIMGESEDSWI